MLFDYSASTSSLFTLFVYPYVALIILVLFTYASPFLPLYLTSHQTYPHYIFLHDHPTRLSLSLKFQLMDSALNDKRQIDVVFTNVSYNIPPTKTFLNRIKAKSLPPPAKILHSVCGYVAKGQSLAILGPSGSGKTTLLNLLAARSEHPLTSGQILFSGKPRTARTKRNVGYVMQDDVFFSNLTVLETLEFTASIRIPNLSSTQKDILIQKVLRRLRLTKCQNTRIGNQQFDKGISGGERKRLNLANELLHNPSLLLADECTSGLDSSSAYTVITMLHELCQDGHTIIATIHQPSSRIFSKFDSVMLLAAGRVAYFGRPDKVVSYFESIDLPFPQNAYNPADFMLELVIDDIAEEETPHSDIETANSQSVSSQKRVLDSWQKNGPTFLKEVAGESQSLTVKNIEPQSGLTEYIESSDSPSAGAPGKRLSSAVEEMLPIGPGDPTSPGNIPARFVRAVTKRFYDVTFQHSQRNMPEKYPNSWWKQTKVLALRAIRQKRGSVIEPFYVLQVLLVAFTSILFWLKNPPLESTIEDRLGCLSFYVVFWAFFATYNAVYAFPSEMQVLNKDRASGAYRLSAYYVAKTMVRLSSISFRSKWFVYEF